LRVELDFQCRDQLLSFFAVQVSGFQRLIKLATTLQEVLAVSFQLFVQAFQVSLLGRR
jgi:hypothetical protein